MLPNPYSRTCVKPTPQVNAPTPVSNSVQVPPTKKFQKAPCSYVNPAVQSLPAHNPSSYTNQQVQILPQNPATYANPPVPLQNEQKKRAFVNVPVVNTVMVPPPLTSVQNLRHHWDASNYGPRACQPKLSSVRTTFVPGQHSASPSQAPHITPLLPSF